MRYLFIILIGVLAAVPCYGQFESAGLREKAIVSLNLHEGTLYAGTRDGLFAKNLNASDASWTLLGFTGEKVTDLLVLSSDTLIAGTWNTSDSDTTYLYRSSDGGNSWQPYQNGFGSDTTSRKVIDLDKVTSRGDTLFAMSPYILYRSVDRGQNWHRLLGEKREACLGGCPSQDFVNADFSEVPLVFTARSAGPFYNSTLFRSTNGGSSWSSKDFRRHLEVLAFHPETNDKAFVAGGSIISKTMDAGQHWTSVLEMPNHEFKDSSISETRDSLVYAGGTDRSNTISHNDTLELLVSTESGQQWGIIRGNSAIKAGGIQQLAVREQAESEVVYLGTDHGLYQFTYDLTPISTFKPKVTIRSPSDSSTHYYLADTTQQYKGIPLVIDAHDIDGTIREFGWAVGEQPYRWTTNKEIIISPSQFGSPGTYQVRVTARNEQGQRARPDTVHLTLVRPSFTKDILVIDGTDEAEFDGNADMFEDADVDSIYESWINRPEIRLEEWDYKSKGMPSPEKLGDYKMVFWHADHYYLVASNAHDIGLHTEMLSKYLNVGGKLIISGWKILKSLRPAADFRFQGGSSGFTYTKGSFEREHLGIKEVAVTGANPPGNVVGAYGVDAYPDVSIDSSRIKGYPVSFYSYMTDVNFVISNIADSSAAFQPIFRLRCRQECDVSEFRRQTIGHAYGESGFKTAFFGFPLSFMKTGQAGAAVDRLLSTMGDFPTSLARRDLPERVRLQQNYPNPFNPRTKIRYALPQADNVTITVYDMLGRRVATLVNGKREAGRHTVTFNADNLSSGVYIYRLQTDSYSRSRKMLLVK